MPRSSSLQAASDAGASRETGGRDRRRSRGRAQSEVIGSILILGLVIITISVVGLAIVAEYQNRVSAEKPGVDIAGDVGPSWATITHVGGPGVPLADLEVVLRSGGTERRYTLDDPGVTLESDDGDDVFDAAETANVSHTYDGTVRLLVIETSEPTRILYDRTFELPRDSVTRPPAVEQFELNDTSADGNASYEVSWRATDADGDITGATLRLRDQQTGTVQDSESYSFGGTGDTGPQTGTVRNASGGGRVYVLELSVTDASGNTVVEEAADTADVEFGADPVVEQFDVTDTSQGQDASYDVTYNVTDEDGDLIEVELQLVDADTGTVRDNVTDTYNETNVTGAVSRSLAYTGGQSKGETFTINIIATDSIGGTDEETVTDVADGGGGGGGGAQAPSIVQFDVTERSCEAYDVDWTVEDAQGDLETVTVELQRFRGNSYQIRDSATYTYGGTSDASDVAMLSDGALKCSDDIRVVITATDGAGNTASEQWVR